MDIDLTGRTAIVTGAGKGIGHAIAVALAGHGARVAVAGLHLNNVAPVAQEIVARGGDAFPIEVDVADGVSVGSMVETCLEKWDRIDILVNNAGIATSQMVEDMPESDWRRVIDVNLTGPFLCSKAVLPTMIAQRYGKIVSVASVGGKRISYNAGACYTASKAGLIGFTRHLAYEVACFGINVNAICPGPTLTPMLERAATPETLRERKKSVPMGRLATTEDQADAVLFLVSDLSSFICGVAVDVDGGSLLGWYDVETYKLKRRQQKPSDES